jgi:hypothetical protein
MSDVLNSLNVPESSSKSWAQEVADAGASEAPHSAPEPVSAGPAPDAPATQEAAPEAPQPQEHAPEDDRRVPLKALQEERQKRAEYERKLQEYERRMAELEQRVPKTPEPAPEPEPDPETDPIGALKHAREQLKRMQEATQAQQYEAQLSQIAYNAANQFKQQAPDYQDAYRYAINSRAQELMALGTPENAIPQILKREEMSLIDTAVRNGRNPAEAIYTFAKARGYQGAQPAAVAPAAPAPVAPQPAPVNPALQQTKQAVAASATAGGAPASKGEMSLNDIANLKGAAFDAAWNKLFGGNKSSVFRE